ncbi:MAG: sugar nucleotide-binding protein, partial [Meiothermus sp.]|uniref:sugar nucleotide-binding protein n=1 Tax=Meiothermus sp. TaxID=1955249 RepID=UPI00298EE6DC
MPKAECPEPRGGPILVTGGTGRLGTALRGLMPGLIAPGREELDITDLASVERSLQRYQPQVVVHAAAYTDVARAETEKAL